MKIRLMIGSILFLLFFYAQGAWAIPGFKEYVIQPKDTLYKICLREYREFSLSTLELIKKTNRIDEKHLTVGKKIFLPMDTELANSYHPLPERIGAIEPAARTILVVLNLEYFGAYENGELKFWGPICPGRKGHETPVGNYSVILKARNKISKLYNVPMPYAIQFSGHYFLHQQAMPGKPASSGCVRLLMEDAKKLFNWAKINDPVIVVPDL